MIEKGGMYSLMLLPAILLGRTASCMLHKDHGKTGPPNHQVNIAFTAVTLEIPKSPWRSPCEI